MEKGFNLKDVQYYFEALLKRWPIAAIIFGTVFVTVLVLTLRKKYVYQATTKLIIGESVSHRTLGNTLFSLNNYFYEKEEFNTYPYIIHSRPVLQKIASRINWVNEEKEPEKFSTLIHQIRYALEIERVGDSRLFTILATDNDPQRAMELANAAAESFIEENLQRKLTRFKNDIKYLTDQLVELEYKLESSQNELIQYIENERVTNFGAQEILPQATGPQDEMKESRGLLQKLNAEKVEQDLNLSKALQRYTEKHPKVIQARQEAGLTTAKIGSESKSLESQDQSREDEAIRAKQKEIKYSILQRKVDINKEMYNALNQKLKELDIASSANDNNMYVMEYASAPGAPLAPNKSRQIMLGFVVSLFFALVIPLVLDFIDPTLRTPEEVEHFLNLPVLTSVPVFEGGDTGTSRSAFPVNNVNSTEAETFRILRTNIRFTLPAASGRVLLVTSSVPSEGKSTIAANLSLTMANAGQRTCLVDADLRISRIHKMFGLNNDVGLTNFLIGEKQTVAEVAKPSEISKNLSIITAGTPSLKPAELLETKEMKLLIKLLLESFDQVIFDTPPAGSIIDASVLSSQADGIIFVLQAGRINRHHIFAAKAQLERVQGRICGVVLNKVDLNKNRYYYYYSYANYNDPAKKGKAAEKNA